MLESMVTTEFTILELAYSWPGRPRSTGATTYKALGLFNPKD